MFKITTLLKDASKYILAAIILAVPLYPKFPFINIPGTFVSIRLEDLILFVGALICLVSIYFNRKEFIKDEINKSIFLYMIVSAISLFSAVFVLQSTVFHIGILHFIRRIEYFFAFFLAVEALRRNPKASDFYLKLLMIVVLTSSIYGIGQKYFNFPIIITQNEEFSKGIALRYVAGGHINSTFAGHYDLATFLVLALPIILCAFTIFKDRFSKVFTAFTFLMGLWLLVNTASRISFVSYVISIVLSLIFVKKIRLIPIVLIVSVLFIGTSSNLIVRYNNVIDVFSKKYINFVDTNYQFVSEVYAETVDVSARRVNPTPTPTSVPVLEDRSTNIRLSVEWPRAFRAFYKNPLLGTGFSSITLATDNDYFRLLGETGILGFLAFMLILFRVISRLLVNYPFVSHYSGSDLALIAGTTAAIPGILVNALFIDVFEASKIAILFWLFVGMSVVLVKKAKYE